MIYIDEDLCTGCGLCLDACNQGALSLPDNMAVVDAELCTSCNRCAAVCITGAIRSAEIVLAGTSSPAPDQPERAPAVWSRTPALSTVPPAERHWAMDVPPAAVPATSKLASAEKILSALVGFVTFMIERRDQGADRARGCTGATAVPRSRQTEGSGRGGAGRGGRGRKRRHRDNRCRAARGGSGT
jgi:NAD-dependent dihydropyrimidine dehydrogenase PreA subunit